MTSLHSPPASPPHQRAPSPTSTPSTHPSIPYNASFTTALSALVLRPNTVDPPTRSIRIVTSSSAHSQPPAPSTSTSNTTDPSKAQPKPKTTTTTTLRSIDFPSLPSIPLSDLPLSLDDPRRKYESAVPGVLLTHPGGHLEGGMGDGVVQSARGLRVVLPAESGSGGTGTGTGTAVGVGDNTLTLRTLPASTPTADSEASSVEYKMYLSLLLAGIPPDPSGLSLVSPTITSPTATSSTLNATTTTSPATAAASTAIARTSAFQSAVAAEIAVQGAELEKRLKARERVVRRNEELKRKVGELEVQRSVERRVEEGWRAKRRGVVG